MLKRIVKTDTKEKHDQLHSLWLTPGVRSCVCVSVITINTIAVNRKWARRIAILFYLHKYSIAHAYLDYEADKMLARTVYTSE